MLVLGVISPELVFKLNPPAVVLNNPPVYALVPVKVTLCGFVSVVQNGPL